MRAKKTYQLLILLMASLAAADEMAQLTAEKEARARELLQENGIEAEGRYLITRYLAYENGGGMISVKQIYEGLIVFDSDAAFHFTAGGTLMRSQDGSPFLGGIMQDVDDLKIDHDQLIGKQEAVQVFSAAAKSVVIPSMTGDGPGTEVDGPICAQEAEAIEAKLGIYKTRVAWRVTCKEHGIPLMYINAVTGSILFFDSGYRS
jgi:hypothetical protein